ncbi:MAG: tetratricopeptide repeat protein [Gammaproteobacteria bacterium]|nr:tetratricopeptide repeat protein [Gammaproteobacteria bacterium]
MLNSLVSAFNTLTANIDAKQYFKKGYEKYEQKNYSTAIIYFTEAIKHDSTFVDAYLCRANSYSQLKNYGRVINDLTQVIKYEPTAIDAYLSRAVSYNELEKYHEAIDDFTHVIKYKSTSVEAYLGRSRSYYKLKKYDEAIDDLTQAIEYEPTSVEAYYGRAVCFNELNMWEASCDDLNQALNFNLLDANEIDNNSIIIGVYSERAHVYMNLERWREACEDWTKLLRFNSNYAPTTEVIYNNRGNGYLNLGLYQEAIQDCTQAIQSNPVFSPAYENRAHAYERLKMWKEAGDDWTLLLQLEPSNQAIFYRRGYCYFNQGCYEESITDYTRFIADDTTCAMVYFDLALSYHCLGQYAEAVANYTQAIRLEPENKDFYWRRADSYFALKAYQEAIDDLTKELQLNPNQDNDNAISLHDIGYAYSKLGQYHEVIVYYTQSIEANPAYELNYVHRADLHLILKEYQEAIDDLTEAVRLNPQDALCFHNRGHAYSQLGQYHEAIADYTQAIELDPSSELTYRRRVEVYNQLGYYQEAEADNKKINDIKNEMSLTPTGDSPQQDTANPSAVFFSSFDPSQARVNQFIFQKKTNLHVDEIKTDKMAVGSRYALTGFPGQSANIDEENSPNKSIKHTARKQTDTPPKSALTDSRLIQVKKMTAKKQHVLEDEIIVPSHTKTDELIEIQRAVRQTQVDIAKQCQKEGVTLSHLVDADEMEVEEQIVQRTKVGVNPGVVYGKFAPSTHSRAHLNVNVNTNVNEVEGIRYRKSDGNIIAYYVELDFDDLKLGRIKSDELRRFVKAQAQDVDGYMENSYRVNEEGIVSMAFSREKAAKQFKAWLCEAVIRLKAAPLPVVTGPAL